MKFRSLISSTSSDFSQSKESRVPMIPPRTSECIHHVCSSLFSFSSQYLLSVFTRTNRTQSPFHSDQHLLVVQPHPIGSSQGGHNRTGSLSRSWSSPRSVTFQTLHSPRSIVTFSFLSFAHTPFRRHEQVCVFPFPQVSQSHLLCAT